jgi:hypothetical protein
MGALMGLKHSLDVLDQRIYIYFPSEILPLPGSDYDDDNDNNNNNNNK